MTMRLISEETKKAKGVKATSIALSYEENLIVKKALVQEVSPKGFNLIFNYQDLLIDSLKWQWDLRTLWYKNIDMYIPDMEMDLEGKVMGIKRLDKGNFEVNMEFPHNQPLYWRECLFELWPKFV